MTGEANVTRAIFAALAVFVMGYPCALGMAAPLAMIRGEYDAQVAANPTFRWQPVAGAAYYELQYDDNEFFDSPVERVKTDNSSYTPTRRLTPNIIYWRVHIIDARRQTGPYAQSYLQIGYRTFTPLLLRGP